MRIQLSFAVLFAIVFACSMHAAPAQAQRVFVSATGSDGNPCSFASPCRTFQHAHDTAPAGGEIDVLDPAGYGAVTITKAITIQGHGFSGISVASGSSGITVNAPITAAVTLNGLLMDGQGVGYNGIVFSSGGNLTVTNCLLQNFHNAGNNPNTGNAILLQPTTGIVNIAITYTTVANSWYGIFYDPASGSPVTNAVIDHVTATANNYGIIFNSQSLSSGSAEVAITNGVASNNGTVGVSISSTSSLVKAAVDNMVINGNAFGIVANQTATIYLGRSVIMGNGTAIQNSTFMNTVYSYKNNQADVSIAASVNTSSIGLQ
jgi:hypothetical protein